MPLEPDMSCGVVQAGLYLGKLRDLGIEGFFSFSRHMTDNLARSVISSVYVWRSSYSI